MTDSRRGFLGALASGAVAAAAGCRVESAPEKRLRPPGALPERDFLGACIRCGRCGPVCPTACVKFGDTFGVEGATPYVEPNDAACVLCMACAEACPTGALTPVEPERVTMGVAEVDPERCWAYIGPLACRACWYVCPYFDGAITLDARLRPTVVADKCVGCGLCQFVCPERPRAIEVAPA